MIVQDTSDDTITLRLRASANAGTTLFGMDADAFNQKSQAVQRDLLEQAEEEEYVFNVIIKYNSDRYEVSTTMWAVVKLEPPPHVD